MFKIIIAQGDERLGRLELNVMATDMVTAIGKAIQFAKTEGVQHLGPDNKPHEWRPIECYEEHRGVLE